MERNPVKSSSLKSIGHDGDILEVEFANGRVYRHSGFPRDQFDRMMQATSVGAHYNAFVRGQYPHTRIEDATPEPEPAA